MSHWEYHCRVHVQEIAIIHFSGFQYLNHPHAKRLRYYYIRDGLHRLSLRR